MLFTDKLSFEFHVWVEGFFVYYLMLPVIFYSQATLTPSCYKSFCTKKLVVTLAFAVDLDPGALELESAVAQCAPTPNTKQQ
jgi:hypothetical protein